MFLSDIFVCFRLFSRCYVFALQVVCKSKLSGIFQKSILTVNARNWRVVLTHIEENRTMIFTKTLFEIKVSQIVHIGRILDVKMLVKHLIDWNYSCFTFSKNLKIPFDVFLRQINAPKNFSRFFTNWLQTASDSFNEYRLEHDTKWVVVVNYDTFFPTIINVS